MALVGVLTTDLSQSTQVEAWEGNQIPSTPSVASKEYSLVIQMTLISAACPQGKFSMPCSGNR
jgi:hypothetical protein